jgi:type IV secretion system protein TrbI
MPMADENQINAAPVPEPQAPAPENASGLRDRRIRPEGVVPKQAQGYVVAGLAVLILMAVMFSKNHAKPAAKDAAPASVAVSTDMNQRKIQELEQGLSADQRQSQQQAMAQKTMGSNSAVTPTGAPAAMQPNGSTVPMTPLPPPTEPPRDPVADAEKAMAFKARFASNLVSAEDGASRPLADASGTADSTPARSPSLPQVPATQTAAAATSTTGNKRVPEVNINSALGQPYVIFEGTTIWSARLEMCQRRRETLDKESIWDEARSTSLSRW